MKIYPIHTGNFKLDGGAMFGVVPKTLWSKVYPNDENNMIPLAMRCMLVDYGDRKVLINNGIGDKQSEKFFKHFYPHGEESLDRSLAKVGYTVNDITDIFLTHLHFDHCGGSIKYAEDGETLVPVFKNAKYWIGKRQWDWAVAPNAREKASFLKENILPIKESGQLELFEGEPELFPGFKVRQYDGHSQGQSIPFINYNGKTLVFMSDLLPTTAHMPLPWVMAFDTQPLKTLDEKKAFFKEAIENEYLLFMEHDINTEACTVKSTEKGPRPDHFTTLEKYFGA